MVQKLLQQLLDETPARQRPLERDEMLSFFQAAPDNLDLEGYRSFSSDGYARNRVLETDEFELVVICWERDQTSNIHDHGSSYCLYRILEGEMIEDLFEVEDTEAGLARPVGERRFGPGEVTVADGDNIHRIRNGSEAPLVTLHFYSPPMQGNNRAYEAVSPERKAGGPPHLEEQPPDSPIEDRSRRAGRY